MIDCRERAGALAGRAAAGLRLAALASASLGALALSASAAAAQAAPPAESAVRLEEIVVTAQKREQRLQEVPVAITAVTQAALETNRIVNIRDLSGMAPNLLVRTQPGGSALPSYTMRGFVNLGSVPGTDKGVAVYVDGVYLGAAAGSIFDLAEIQRIEVLRGPQGTLFGRNSTAGAINFITAEPRDEFSLKETLTVGNYDQFRSTTRLNTPRWGAVSASAAYTHSERRGDIRNLGGGTVWDFTPAFNGKTTRFTSPRYLGGHNVDAVALAVKFQPSDSFRTVYRFDYTRDDFAGDGFGVLYEQPLIRGLLAGQPNPLTQVSSKRPDAVNNWDSVPTHLKVWGHSLTSNWWVSDQLTVKNLLAVRKAGYTGPFSNFSGLGGLLNLGQPVLSALLGSAVATSTVGAPLLIQAATTNGSDEQFSDELQLNYSSDFVTLTTGALYYHQLSRKFPSGVDAGLGRARSGPFRVYPGFLVPFAGQAIGSRGRLTKIKMESEAVYGQGEFHVLPAVDLVLGLRYTEDKKNGVDNSVVSGVNPNPIAIAYKADQTTYNAGVNYKWSFDRMVYAKYSTGYISGGALGTFVYAPELAKSLEAGIKADWLDGRLRTNLAVFQVKYTDVQFPVAGNTLTPPRPEVTQATVNAGDAKASGFELETSLAPIRPLLLTANVGYTDFKFTRLNPQLTNGNAEYLPIFRPKWNATVSGQYTGGSFLEGVDFVARLDGAWRSRQNGTAGIPLTSASFSAAEQAAYKAAATIHPYWIWNGRLALQGIKLGGANATLALWSRNLFDEKSPSLVQSLVTVIAADYEPARTVGLDFTLAF